MKLQTAFSTLPSLDLADSLTYADGSLPDRERKSIKKLREVLFKGASRPPARGRWTVEIMVISMFLNEEKEMVELGFGVKRGRRMEA